MDMFSLSRNWFDWCFENPEKVCPTHTAIYFFAIEHCNRMGWKEKFGFPTQMAMDAVGVSKHQTYIKYFNDLVEWGFLKLVQRSANQYSANIISIPSALPKNGKALSRAAAKHVAKQIASIGQSKHESDGSIDIPTTILPITILPTTGDSDKISFLDFWDLYDKKVGEKSKLEKKWDKLKNEEKKAVMEYIPKYKIAQPDKKYRKNPETFLNNKSWNDELPGTSTAVNSNYKFDPNDPKHQW